MSETYVWACYIAFALIASGLLTVDMSLSSHKVVAIMKENHEAFGSTRFFVKLSMYIAAIFWLMLNFHLFA